MAKAPKKTKSDAQIVLPTSPLRGAQTRTPATGLDSDASVPNPLRSRWNVSIQDVRTARDIHEAIDLLERSSGDMSHAVTLRTRLADTKLKIRVYDSTHQLSIDGHNLLRSITAGMDALSDYTYGFDDRQSLSGVVESLVKEATKRQACAVELVLNEERLPDHLQVIPVSSLKWKTGKKKVGKSYKLVPTQTIAGEELPLDYPTVFYCALDQDPATAYSAPSLESAVKNTIYQYETVEDIRKVVKRSGHSRLAIKLLVEEMIKAMPPEVKADPTAATAWMEAVREQVKTEVEKIPPEAALVFYSTAEPSYINSEIGASADYKPLMELVDSVAATSLHTPPSVLGKRMGGSQNTSSTESLLFLKTAKGPQKPVATVLTRALTLAVRLYGFDGYVIVELEEPELRPTKEMAAFEQMIQTRLMELLSLGVLTDDEFAERVGAGPRNPSAPQLSGTLFTMKVGASDTPSANGDPARRALTGNSPKSSGGKDNTNRG